MYLSFLFNLSLSGINSSAFFIFGFQVPGQRALALQLLASVLDKALYNLQQSDVGYNVTAANCIDWQAVWAFALGPEPELVLSLRC